MDLLVVTFIASNTISIKRPFTIYEIEVKSLSAKSWVIFKRYNDFLKLNNDLLKSIAKAGIHLPALPPKRLRALNVQIVERRMAELQDYLRSLLNNPEIVRAEETLIFLEVPMNIRAMLAPNRPSDFSKNVIKSSKNAKIDQTKEVPRTSRHNSNSKEYQSVSYFLKKLKNDKNKANAIKCFEVYYFDRRPRFTTDLVKLLFCGEKSQGGLIKTCGDIKYSFLASHAALYLLSRLLDVERNLDARLFLDTFVALELVILKELNLHDHILSERGTRLAAFRLVLIIHQRVGDPLSLYVPDTWAKQAYMKWTEQENETFEDSSTVKKSRLKIPNLQETSFQKIAEQSFDEHEKLLNSIDDQRGWRIVGDNGNPVHLSYKNDPNNEIIIMRCGLAIPYTVSRVFELLIDGSRQKEWNLKYQSGENIETLSENCAIVHCSFKSSSSPYKYRDFCLLRSWREINGVYSIVFQSITHPNVPSYKNHVRSTLVASGFQISPCIMKAVDENGQQTTIDSCIVNFTANLDREGVLIVSPDLLGETTDLLESMANITTLLDLEEDDAEPSSSGNLSSNCGFSAIRTPHQLIKRRKTDLSQASTKIEISAINGTHERQINDSFDEKQRDL